MWSQKQTKTIAQRIEETKVGRFPTSWSAALVEYTSWSDEFRPSEHRFPFLLLSLSLYFPSLSILFSSLSFRSFSLLLFSFIFLLADPCFYKQLPHPIYSLLYVPCMWTHGMPCVTHMHRPFQCIVTHGLPCVTHMASMCRQLP